MIIGSPVIASMWSKGMIEFVKKGVRTSVALSREESDRQAEAA